ncbi:hypothetical protein BGZ65_006681 [Modicella reniformis]|uniref:Uncharacterized protein n=1 Tax=Modicella reniformis TaxID=1440133 RepID=A0A9P6LU34_9FUNG|nr:hypothetical protein BGZ65_006681 [Modicella reniformis]
MPTRNAYIGTISIFAVAFGLQVATLFVPKWVQYESPSPHYTEVNYGLFQRCSTLTDDCRRFPQGDWGDCDHDKNSDRWVKLCLEWRVAAGTAVASSIVGLWILAGLGTVLYTGQRFHAQGWKHILGLIGVFAGLQIVSMALVAHVTHTSSMFVYNKLGLSFFLNIGSWALGAVLALGVILYAKYGRQGGHIALE